MISVENIKLRIGFTDKDIIRECSKKLNISFSDILNFEILKQSIDARHKPNISYVLNVGVCLKENLENKFKDKSIIVDHSILEFAKKKLDTRPVVVGFGPSGIFSALMLARMGLKPIVIEQGENVEDREKRVLEFWNDRKLNKYSNVQFGEGGAGTFSDGKLNSNLSSKDCLVILNEFYYYGAPKEILFISKPHIGSDKLKSIVKNMREDIIAMGGEVRFSTKMDNIIVENGKIKAVECFDIKNNKTYKLETNCVILAVGHSARDSFEVLKNNGIKMKQKPFAMGVRIEQKQLDINNSQYGIGYNKLLPNADYKLVAHLPNGRSVFTFCMCPGGYVVASSSNEGEIVTNGMSNFARDGVNANSALLVNVNPSDYENDDVLAGLKFQEKYEKLAFEFGGANYNAPYESVYTFLNDKEKILNNGFKSSFKPNLTFSKIKNYLPKFIVESLKLGIKELNLKMKNFAKDENLLIGIESRSSCPLTIVRNENFQSNIEGLYPIGEGAGYAGGIVSSALDGIKCATKIYEEI